MPQHYSRIKWSSIGFVNFGGYLEPNNIDSDGGYYCSGTRQKKKAIMH